jgi:hypothetical protein
LPANSFRTKGMAKYTNQASNAIISLPLTGNPAG